MAKNTSNGIREFVKNSLNSYYKNFLVKLSDNPQPTDINPAIKMVNDGSVYVYGVGGYEGFSIQNTSTLLKVINSAESNIANINSSLYDLSINSIKTIKSGNKNIGIEKSTSNVSIFALGYTYDLEKNSFAELNSNIATGLYSHAEGSYTSASGAGAHAEGCLTTANGEGSHTEGSYTNTIGKYSHTEGYHTTARNEAEHAEGKYNISNIGKTIHSVGIGYKENDVEHRKNAIEVLKDGSIFITGLATTNSYDGTSITNVSTLQEVINEKLDKSSAAAGLRYEVVTVLPLPGETNIVYLVSSTTTTSGNVYDEKMWINGKYETIGTTLADLTNYYTKTESQQIFASVSHTHNHYINGQQTSSISIYATTNSGQMGQFVYGTGSGTPQWTSTISPLSINGNNIINYYGASNTVSIYAPTTSGTDGQFLRTNGTSSSMSWFTVNLNGTSIPSSMSSVSIYAPTTSGTAGYFLKANGSGTAPIWVANPNTDTKQTISPTTSKTYLTGVATTSTTSVGYANDDVYMQNGNITAVAFYQSSDERLKNIKSELSVEDCYKLINDCSTIIYSLKTDEKDQNQIGMIAQQVKEIMPEVVQESNGYYSINYSRLSVVALNLIKDLSERIIELEKDHNKLEELIKRVEKLEK